MTPCHGTLVWRPSLTGQKVYWAETPQEQGGREAGLHCPLAKGLGRVTALSLNGPICKMEL